MAESIDSNSNFTDATAALEAKVKELEGIIRELTAAVITDGEYGECAYCNADEDNEDWEITDVSDHLESEPIEEYTPVITHIAGPNVDRVVAKAVQAALAARNAQWIEWAISECSDDDYICWGCGKIGDTRESIEHFDGCKVAALLKGNANG